MPVVRLHVLEDQVVERADAHAAVGQRLVGRLARQRDQFVDAVDRQVLARDEHHHRVGHRVHEAEVLGLQLHRGVGQRRQDHLVGRALEDVVAVGRRRQHLLRGHRAADAAEVLHQHLLAQLLAERDVEDARDGVRRAARRVGDHQVDRLGRVGLRERRAGAEQQAGRPGPATGRSWNFGHGNSLEGAAGGRGWRTRGQCRSRLNAKSNALFFGLP